MREGEKGAEACVRSLKQLLPFAVGACLNGSVTTAMICQPTKFESINNHLNLYV